jgi:Mlc titration factor MtfA (ptsG expression regulator)
VVGVPDSRVQPVLPGCTLSWCPLAVFLPQPASFVRIITIFNLLGVLFCAVGMGAVGYVVVNRTERRLLIEHERSERLLPNILPASIALRLKDGEETIADGNEKHFEGCAGLEITDEIRVTIAGQACLLSLARDLDYYPNLRVILVYPDRYVARNARFTSPLPHHEDHDPRLGESWPNGVVVLSWSGIGDSRTSLGEFRNVVAHEFAHQLDQEDGAADGIPVVDGRHTHRLWARLISDEFARHVSTLENGGETVLDAYGARNRAEFFAVAVEAFFERPRDFRSDRPELYNLLCDYFGQDPAGR